MMREGQNLGLVIIPKGAVQTAADEILAVVREPFLETLTSLLKDLHQTEINQMRQQDMNELLEIRRAATEAQDRLAKLRSNLRNMTSRVDVSPDTLRGAITKLEDERDRLVLDTESMTVRKKAIEVTISRITEKAAEEMKRDRIAVELEKLI